MTKSSQKELAAIWIALITTLILFIVNTVYAESTIRTKVKINGEDVVNETVTGDGSQKNEVDVSIKNGVGSVKINQNGEERTIQITPAVKGDTTENEVDEVKQDETDKKEDTTEAKTEKQKEKAVEQKKIRKDLIQQMMEKMDELFEKLSSIFSGK